MKKINILSLFDGISCGQIALNKAEINYNKYFASEINRKAISVTQYNYPETIQLGDVRKICISKLPPIDLLIGGSPCQGFSFAGKNLNFDDPRSKLFFEYHKILDELNCRGDKPYFLLENVKMKKESERVISSHLRVEPLSINSNLVSAQNRDRLYWTNINVETLPIDRKIYFKDIVEKNFNSSLILKGKALNRLSSERNRVFCCDSNKAPTLMCSQYKKPTDALIIKYDKFYRWPSRKECEKLQTLPEGYTGILRENDAIGCIGNGWTIDIVSHIFSFLPNEYKKN